MYGSRAVTPLVLISDDVINRILKLDIQTNILVYVTRCRTDLTRRRGLLASRLLYYMAGTRIVCTIHAVNLGGARSDLVA